VINDVADAKPPLAPKRGQPERSEGGGELHRDITRAERQVLVPHAIDLALLTTSATVSSSNVDWRPLSVEVL
jgi:hypothetical protein